jgi:hypothetical protein
MSSGTPGGLRHNTTERSAEKDIEKDQRQASFTSIASGDLDEALVTLDISSKDADEAFAFIRDHPNADIVRQEALEILADPKALRRLLWKIDLTIVPCVSGPEHAFTSIYILFLKVFLADWRTR